MRQLLLLLVLLVSAIVLPSRANDIPQAPPNIKFRKDSLRANSVDMPTAQKQVLAELHNESTQNVRPQRPGAGLIRFARVCFSREEKLLIVTGLR